MVALATGGIVVGAEVMLTGCNVGSKSEAGFSAGNIAMLDEVGETIIPTTNTPGAKSTQIGNFMKTMVTDCYTQSEQDAFIKGMSELDENCKKAIGKTFMEATPQQRHDYLVTLEKEAKEQNEKNVVIDKSRRAEYELVNQKVPSKQQKEFDSTPKHYYTMMKQLTLLGFFTSKTGMTETLRHIPVPGKYDGEYAYKKGDKAWAE
jgi:hypothetical protein